MNQKKIILTYGSIASDYDELYAKPSGHIDDLLNCIRKDANVLDLGCGAGNNAVYLSKLGYNVTGIDLSEVMLNIARKKKSNAKFIQGDVRNLNFEGDSYDSVISSYIFCHLSSKTIEKCLARIHQILTNNGLLFIELFTGNLGEITLPEPLNNTLRIDYNIIPKNCIETLLCTNKFKILKSFCSDETDFWLPGVQDTCIIAKKI